MDFAGVIDESLARAVQKAIGALKEQIVALQEYKSFLDKRGKSGPERTTFLTKTAESVIQNNNSVYTEAVAVIDRTTQVRIGIYPRHNKQSMR